MSELSTRAASAFFTPIKNTSYGQDLFNTFYPAAESNIHTGGKSSSQRVVSRQEEKGEKPALYM